MGTLLRHPRLARNRGRGYARTNSALVALQGRQIQWFMTTEFATPVFGIKAKRRGKTRATPTEVGTPVFGIKAKLTIRRIQQPLEFATPVFGIKAKLKTILEPHC